MHPLLSKKSALTLGSAYRVEPDVNADYWWAFKSPDGSAWAYYLADGTRVVVQGKEQAAQFEAEHPEAELAGVTNFPDYQARTGSRKTASPDWEPFCDDCGDSGCPSCDFGQTPNHDPARWAEIQSSDSFRGDNLGGFLTDEEQEGFRWARQAAQERADIASPSGDLCYLTSVAFDPAPDDEWDEGWFPEGPNQRPPARMQARRVSDDKVLWEQTVFPYAPWSAYDAAIDILVREGWRPIVEDRGTCPHGMSADLCADPVNHYASRKKAGYIEGVDCPMSQEGFFIDGPVGNTAVCPSCGQTVRVNAGPMGYDDNDEYRQVVYPLVHLLPGKNISDRMASRKTGTACVYSQETHHSDDIMEVWHGSDTPTYICGYHEQRFGVPGTGRYERETGRTASRKTAMPSPADLGVMVGDIFYCSWGYDQTNVEFYEVIRLTGAGVEVLPVRSAVVEDHGRGGQRVIPVPGAARDFDVLTRIDVARGTKPTKVCRLKNWGEPAIVLSRDHTARKWDGTPKYETDPYGGH